MVLKRFNKILKTQSIRVHSFVSLKRIRQNILFDPYRFVEISNHFNKIDTFIFENRICEKYAILCLNFHNNCCIIYAYELEKYFLKKN